MTIKTKHDKDTRKAIMVSEALYGRVKEIAEKNHRKLTDQLKHWCVEEEKEEIKQLSDKFKT